MVARVRRAFQVSQGSVETLFTRDEKRLHDFAANGLPNLIRIARVLWKIFKKTF